MLSLKVFKNPTRYNIKLRPPGVRSLARLVRARVKAQPKSQGHQGHGRVGHGIKNLGNPGPASKPGPTRTGPKPGLKAGVTLAIVVSQWLKNSGKPGLEGKHSLARTLD